MCILKVDAYIFKDIWAIIKNVITHVHYGQVGNSQTEPKKSEMSYQRSSSYVFSKYGPPASRATSSSHDNGLFEVGVLCHRTFEICVIHITLHGNNRTRILFIKGCRIYRLRYMGSHDEQCTIQWLISGDPAEYSQF
jgi:hypothetical protein